MNSTAQLIAILAGFLTGSAMIAILIFVPILFKKRTLKKAAKASVGTAHESFTSNDFIPQEIGHSFGALILGFFFCTAAIYAYYLIAPDTLVWFSVTAILWYLAGFLVYALQKIMRERKKSEKQ